MKTQTTAGLLCLMLAPVACAHDNSSAQAESPMASAPVDSTSKPVPTPEATPAPEAERSEPEAAEPKSYSPKQLTDELRFDNNKENPAWGQNVMVKGLAVSGPILNGDRGIYYVTLADEMEHSMLHEVHCLLGETSPEVEEGEALVVTGTPVKPEYGPLGLENCSFVTEPSI